MESKEYRTNKEDEFESIMALNNPTIKKYYLEKTTFL